MLVQTKAARWTLVILTTVFLLSACVTTQGGGEASQVSSDVQEVSYSPYTGPKKRIAVLPFENKVRNNWWDRSWNVESGLTDMTITEVMETNRFIVVERTSLDEVLGEQDLGASGRVRQETAAKVGELLGAQVLIKGVVTEFEQKESGGMGGIAIAGFGIGGKVDTGHVAIDLRIIDATTGQVLQSHRSESQIKSTGMAGVGFFKGVAFGGATYKKTSLGKATRAAITDAVKFIVSQMETRPWEGRLVKVDGRRVFINAGSNMNINDGTVFTVYSKGDELIDPETGLNLGSSLTRAGNVRVIQVSQKFAIAEIMDGSGFKRGDILKLE